jgi:YQGE family putative transporter
MFIALAYFFTETFALKYALIVVAGLQLLSLPLAKNIVREVNNKDSV